MRLSKTAAITTVLGQILLVGLVAGRQESSGNQTGVEDSGGLAEGFREALVSVLLDSVEGLTKILTDVLTRILVSYPDVTKPYVLEIHRKVFLVSSALAVAALVWIGLLSMTGRIGGVRQVMYVLGSVAFGAVAPSLLWYLVELSRLTTEALVPTDPELIALTRFSLELILVAFLNAFLLLGTVMIFAARDVFLMLGVALSPLMGLMAATPSLRGFASKIASIWIACLLIGPLDAVVLDLTLSMLEWNDGAVPSWIWALGGLSLMFVLPMILLQSGSSMFYPMTRVASNAAGTAWKYTGGAAFARYRASRESDHQEWDRQRDDGNRFRRGDD